VDNKIEVLFPSIASILPLVGMSEGEFYARMFMEALTSKSSNKQDPISEWTLNPRRVTKCSHCICTKQIELNYHIQNNITGEICVIGCDCVMRWIDPKLECEDCGQVLGNKRARLSKQDFKCRSCKVANKKWLEKVARYTLHYPGPWKGKTFKVVAENERWAETLMLTPKWKGDKKVPYYYDSLHDFQTYASSIYDIIDVEF
jgi:hypothetical protein